jgi:hypothetical protein
MGRWRVWCETSAGWGRAGGPDRTPSINSVNFVVEPPKSPRHVGGRRESFSGPETSPQKESYLPYTTQQKAIQCPFAYRWSRFISEGWTSLLCGKTDDRQDRRKSPGCRAQPTSSTSLNITRPTGVRRRVAG